MQPNTGELEPIAYSIRDAMKVSSLSRTTLFRLARAGKIEMRAVGARKLVLADSLKRLIETEAA
jgi:hypothetical protein